MKTVLFHIVFLVIPVLTKSWSHVNSEEERGTWKHYHSKRHLPMSRDSELKKRSQPPRYKKKPAGSLIPPLREDDIDNDEVVSVAIGPPLIKPRYDKVRKKQPDPQVSASNTVQFVSGVTTNPKLTTSIVVDILTELGKEFLSRQVSEDFVFGQYVGNAMRNLTRENKLQLQHHILELIVQFQKIGHMPASKPAGEVTSSSDKRKIIKIKPLNSTTEATTQTVVSTSTPEKTGNDTEEWSVLANLENMEISN